ncbi:hypothetical protein SAMN05444858_14812, partial [Micromonospora avicenniae]
MARRWRVPVVGGLALVLVATLGGMEALPGQASRPADQTASAEDGKGLFGRLGDAARGMVGDGPSRPRPEVISAGLSVQEK